MATGIVAYTVATVLAISYASSGAALDLAIGPVVVLAVEQLGVDGGAVTTLGPGLLVVAIAGGIVNAVGALTIAWWGRRRAG